VALVITDVSEGSIAFIVRVTRIGKLGTTLEVISNRLRNTACVTSQKTEFFIAINAAIFWDIVPFSPYVCPHFGGIYHLQLQGRKSAEQETTA
jgi:hypothetical protein